MQSHLTYADAYTSRIGNLTYGASTKPRVSQISSNEGYKHFRWVRAGDHAVYVDGASNPVYLRPISSGTFAFVCTGDDDLRIFVGGQEKCTAEEVFEYWQQSSNLSLHQAWRRHRRPFIVR